LESIYAIILINVLIFIGIFIRPDLVSALALSPSSVWGHPWTIITSMFTHYNFTHILFNMWALYFFGSAILRILGVQRFWLLYMIGGIIGSLAYVLLRDTNAPVIGASGAIFALGGALAVLRPQTKVVFFPIPIPVPLWIGVLTNFVIISLMEIMLHLNVAWQAHLGGLIFGAAAGWFYRRRSFNAYRWN